MAQKIDIGVSASAQSAERSMDGLEKSVGGIAEAVNKVERGAKAAARGLNEMEAAARRLEQTRGALSKHFGRDISLQDAGTFEENFSRLQRRRTRDARAMKPFGSVGDWWNGHSGMFTKEAHAQRHRAWTMSAGMAGTSFASQFGAPPAGGGGGGGGGGLGGLGGLGGGAMGLLKGTLALAGIGSLMAMAQRAVSNASTESMSVDSTKRRMGDFGGSYYSVMAASRMAGAGMGINYLDSANFAGQYVRESGRGTSALGLRDGLRTGMGLGRSYGLDPGEGVSFMGTMRRNGVAGDDQANRRVALMIADAIEKGGYTAKADEVLRAVADFSTMAARFSFQTPNVGAFASGLASLTATGSPGLDPNGAATLINSADSTLRRGGGMGEASLNFSYMALNRQSPGLNVVTAKAMMQGGLFGTSNDLWDQNSPLGRYYTKNKLRRPLPGGMTNFDAITGQMRKQYGNSEYLLDAMQNHFGLSSYGQSAALLEMQDKGVLGASERMLSARGMSMEDISPTGLQSVARIANARSVGDLHGVYDSIMQRGDVGDPIKWKLAASANNAAKNNDFEGMRSALLDAVGKSDQEKTPVTETRDALKAISDALTTPGGAILSVLNPIRIGIDAIASAKGDAGYRTRMQAYENSLRGGGTGGGPASNVAIDWGGMNARSGGSMDSMAGKAMAYFQGKGFTKAQAAGIVGNLVQESNLNIGAVGDGGSAYGIGQWHADRQAQFKKVTGQNMKGSSMDAQLAFVRWELYNTHRKAYRGLQANPDNVYGATAAFGNDFESPAGSGGAPEGMSGWRDRLGAAAHLYGGTPLPQGDPGGAAAIARSQAVHVTFDPATVRFTDQSGAIKGDVNLLPVLKAQPSGFAPKGRMF
jgi:hypothetical protein